VNIPWSTCLLPRLHYKFQRSCILKPIGPPLRAALPVTVWGSQKEFSSPYFRHRALYTVYFSRSDEKHWRQQEIF